MEGAEPGLPPWARVSPKRLDHIRRVAELVSGWSMAMAVPAPERARWLRAVWLHDALRDAPEEELARWAPGIPGPVELLHGPAGAARAEAEGEADAGVLDAVRYHSLGFAGWDMAGQVLYCADYLEPGRSFDRAARAGLAREFPADPDGVLRDVARARISHLILSGWTLPEPTFRFWNRLAVSSSPR